MTSDEKMREILEHATALHDSMKFIYQNDSNNHWKYSGFKHFMRKYNELVKKAVIHFDPQGLIDLYDLELVPGSMDTTIGQQKEFFDSILINLAILISLLSNKLNLRQDEVLNLKNFIQSNLRKAILKEPVEEKDIQDAIEQLLIGKGLSKGIDYDREIGRIKISIKEVIPDFIFPKLDLALEVKFTNKITKTKSIIDQINADIQAYKKTYRFLLFVIYDFGTIRDEDEFKNGIDNTSDIKLIIIKH